MIHGCRVYDIENPAVGTEREGVLQRRCLAFGLPTCAPSHVTKELLFLCVVQNIVTYRPSASVRLDAQCDT